MLARTETIKDTSKVHAPLSVASVGVTTILLFLKLCFLAMTKNISLSDNCLASKLSQST